MTALAQKNLDCFSRNFSPLVGRGNVPMAAVNWAFALSLTRDAQSLHRAHHRHRIPCATARRRHLATGQFVRDLAIGLVPIPSRMGRRSASQAAAAALFASASAWFPSRTPRSCGCAGRHLGATSMRLFDLRCPASPVRDAISLRFPPLPAN